VSFLEHKDLGKETKKWGAFQKMECPLPLIKNPSPISRGKIMQGNMASSYIKKSKQVFTFLHLLLESKRDVTTV
jgi:hypothetical protein